MWSPSSLIFLVLLGVWAAYFLQYWIRRRDHLATARSVEQFSEAMRVLERRDTTPRTDLSEPAPRSWNLHPTRAAARPQVLVKRAVPAHPDGRQASTVTERVDADPPVPETTTPAGAAPVGRRAPRPAATTAPEAPVQSPPPARVRPGRRVRALLLLAALAGLVAVSVLVPLGALEVWALAPAVAALLLAFAYVRSGVRAERRLRAARRRRAEQARPRRTAAPTEHTTVRAQRQEPAPHPVAEAVGGESATGTETPVTRAEAMPDAPADVAGEGRAETVEPAVPSPVAEEPEEVRYVHLVDEDDIPLTWDPVPVPRPTYTMKARAERPEVPPAEVTQDPEPAALSEDGPVDERRAAGA